MPKGLDDFVNESVPVDAPAETPPEPVAALEPEPVEAAPPAPAEPALEPPEEVPEPADVKGLRNALQAVRKDRSDYKGERDRLAGEMAALKAQLDEIKRAPPPVVPPPPPVAPVAPEPRPNPFEDPDGHERWLRAQMRAEMREEAAQTANEEAFKRDLRKSEARFRKDAPPDTEDAIEAFKRAAANNQDLRIEFANADDPFKWAYQQGKLFKSMSDPAAMRAAIAAEERAKVIAEMEGRAPPASAAPVILPRSLSGAQSTGARMTEVEAAPSFEDIFQRRKRK